MEKSAQADYVNEARKKKTDTQELISRERPEVELSKEELHKFAAYLLTTLKGDFPRRIAGEIHDGWTASKAESGYDYGPVRNDDPEKGPLTHPLMKPAAELTDEELKWDIDTATQALVQLILVLQSELRNR